MISQKTLFGGLACSLCLAVALSASEPSTNKSIPIGSSLPDLKLTDYQGREWQVAEFRDKPALVVAFVGTQCPLAKLYTARLVELEKSYRDRGVAFVAVDSNVQDSLAEMAAHARKFGLDFPFVKDPAQELADRTGVTRTPEVCVFDSERKLRYRGRIDDQYGIGYTKDNPSTQELVDAMEAILAGKEIIASTTNAPGCLIGRSRSTPGSSESDVTYADQVSRILQNRCVNCHRPGEIGPMDLSNFEDASAWSDMIVEVIKDGRMPPWHASQEPGTFENDRRMQPDEMATIQKWAAAGAPRGDASHDPAPLQFVDGWQLPREPDLVIPMSDHPINVQAKGEVKYQYFVADPKLTEDKWVNGMEIVPGNRAIVHHILIFVRDKANKKRGLDGERGFLVGYSPGSRVQMMPEGLAKRIPANSEFVFQVHYTPNGTEQTDLSKVGFLFADPKSITHEVHTTSSVQTEFRIPPRDSDYKTTAMQPEELPNCDLLSMSPHMHLRGKSFRYTAVYPDGKREVILDIPQYDFNWQTEYRLANKKSLPKGTRMYCEAVFDNSEKNLNNPDPSVWVHWGDQTYEEMMIGYFHIAVPIDPATGVSAVPEKVKIDRKMSPHQIFELLDTNGDGKLVREEVPKKLMPMFETLDKNKDGVLEKSELPK